MDFFHHYIGYLVGFGGLAAVLLLNQVIFRHRWASYPTLDEYLAAHPGCTKPDGVVCSKCGTKALGLGVRGRGRIYRCTSCETELFRMDNKPI
jgi:hypothetical protein